MSEDISNLGYTIVPNSNRLNADDLIGQDKVITVTKVEAGDKDSPIFIHYEGENGRPYHPCKSMRRVLIHAWGNNGHDWVGKSMRLYCDPSVKFGGVAVGGIRISELSDIDKTMNLSLTVTRAKRQPYVVKPLAAQPKPEPKPEKPAPTFDERFDAAYSAVENKKVTADKAIAMLGKEGWTLTDDHKAKLKEASQ